MSSRLIFAHSPVPFFVLPGVGEVIEAVCGTAERWCYHHAHGALVRVYRGVFNISRYSEVVLKQSIVKIDCFKFILLGAGDKSACSDLAAYLKSVQSLAVCNSEIFKVDGKSITVNGYIFFIIIKGRYCVIRTGRPVLFHAMYCV